VTPTILLERDAEVVALGRMLDAARHGDGQLVTVEGSAGIGKTRLLSEARAGARAARIDVLIARPGELEGDFAFGVVRQLFEPALANSAPDVRAELLAGAAQLAAPLFGSAPTSASSVEGESSFAKLHGLYWLAANFALRNPTLLVVDDLHWADEPSLRWLAYLARRLDGLPLVLLVATRPPEQANAPTLVRELLADPLALVIRPGALGHESAAALAREHLGVEPHPDFAAALQTGSGGNPLYLGALLDAVRREGIEPSAEQAQHVLELGPEAVSRGVAARLRRLPDDAATLLRAAAILGDRTMLSVVAELAGLDATAALSAADALLRYDLLAEENPLEFVHPVVRTAVLEDMDAGEQIRIHRRAAEVLLQAGALPEQAAAHLAKTIPNHDPFVVATLREAAGRSLAQGAPEAAVVYARRALEEPPQPGERLDVLHQLGVAELHTGATEASEHLRQALEDLDDFTRRPDIVLDYVRAGTLFGRHTDARNFVRATSDRVRHLDPDLHWRLEGRLIIWSQFDPRLYALATKRLTTIEPRSLSDGVGAGVLLAAMAIVEARRGVSRARAIEFAQRAWASRASEDASERLNISNALVALMLAGEVDVALRRYAAVISSAQRHSDLLSLAALHLIRGNLRYQRGELLSAEEDLRPLTGLAFHESPDFQIFRAAFLAEVLLERGELREAETLVAQPIAASEGFRVHFLAAAGRICLATGRPEQALADFLEAGSTAAAAGIENPAWAPWRSLAAFALHRLGRVDEARELARKELQLSRRWGAARTVGVSLRALGLVEGGPTGERLLREAVELLAPSRARLEHARALVDLGAALRRGNSRKEARELLGEGLELANMCGANALVKLANNELATTGAHPRKILLSGVDALTASERRVAHMAAEELSNKEIAQGLFVTVKTVEVHLSRVYRKLDITSRRQLADALEGPVKAASPG
jgi:DNA-binding CsgD family transcriptional regulator/tetratricopeptide (TPR) repeat protein